MNRVRRWHTKTQGIGRARSWSSNTEEEHDVVYAFFVFCYHLRDWLVNSSAVTRETMRGFFESNKEMQACRDICNGVKHFRFNENAEVADREFTIIREYVPASWLGDRPHINEKWYVIHGDSKYGIFELADKCFHLWQHFLHQQSLA